MHGDLDPQPRRLTRPRRRTGGHPAYRPANGPTPSDPRLGRAKPGRRRVHAPHHPHSRVGACCSMLFVPSSRPPVPPRLLDALREQLAAEGTAAVASPPGGVDPGRCCARGWEGRPRPRPPGRASRSGSPSIPTTSTQTMWTPRRSGVPRSPRRGRPAPLACCTPMRSSWSWSARRSPRACRGVHGRGRRRPSRVNASGCPRTRRRQRPDRCCSPAATLHARRSSPPSPKIVCSRRCSRCVRPCRPDPTRSSWSGANRAQAAPPPLRLAAPRASPACGRAAGRAPPRAAPTPGAHAQAPAHQPSARARGGRVGRVPRRAGCLGAGRPGLTGAETSGGRGE